MSHVSSFLFFRHGESQANAGQATVEPASITLTGKGRTQAAAIASALAHAPELVISSPFVRARETAMPTLDMFPSAHFEIWPVQEFTYLAPALCANTTASQRRPIVDAYWRAADPQRIDGDGAESFAQFISRVRDSIKRLEVLQASGVRSATLFGHGQFLQALRWLLVESESVTVVDMDTMRAFRSLGARFPIHNGESFTMAFDGTSWQTER